MPDTPDDHDPPAPRRAASRPRRPRFALPAEHHDDGVRERIEAFLEGPSHSRRRERNQPARPTAVPRRAIPLDTRPDWDAALRQEDARSTRYGRPCAVLVVDVRDVPDGAVDRFAAVVGAAIRHESRETDRVARVASTRFHVLLPETRSAEAEVLAARIRVAVLAKLPPGRQPTVAIAAGAARRGEGLPAVLLRAVAALADDALGPEARSTA